MKKRMFSPRLYLDGIKQLRIIGVLCTVAIAFIGIISPVMSYLSQRESGFEYTTPHTLNYLNMNPLIILLFCAIAPLMVLYLFSFLNKRDSSDFYHAIPETRQCLFLSFFGAVVTWLLFITVTTGAIITFVYSLFPQLYEVNYSSVLILSFNAFAGALFIAAAVAIAMCVTGTVFTNVLVALLLIFLPRMLIQIAIIAVADALPLVSGVSFASFLSYEYNVPVGLIFGFLFEGSTGSLTRASSGVYTLVVGVLYTVFALVLFVKRRSETAGQAAPSRRLQALYRLLIGAVLSSVAVMSAFAILYGYGDFDSDSLFTLLLLFLASILLMLAFQVISTRTFKGIGRYAATGTLSLLIFCGVYFGGLCAMYHTTLSYSPKAEDITSVRFVEDTEYGTPNYFESKVSAIEFTDKVTHKIVAEQLQYSKDLIEISLDRYHTSELPCVSVAIKSGGISHYRTIRIRAEQLSQIYNTVYDTEAFRKVYTDLPKSIAGMSTNENGIIENPDTLYQVFLQEVSEIGFEKWYALQSTVLSNIEIGGDSSADSVITLLDCRLYEGMQWYSFSIPLDVTVLPKTAQAYLEQQTYARENSEALLAVLRAANTFDEQDSLNITFFNFEGAAAYGSVYINRNVEEYTSDIQSLANSLKSNQIPTVTKPFYRIRFENVIKTGEENGKDFWYEYESYMSYYQGDTLPDWILTLLDKQQESDVKD